MKTSSTFSSLVYRHFVLVFLVLLVVNCSSDDTAANTPEEEETEGGEILPEDRLPLIAISTNGNQIVESIPSKKLFNRAKASENRVVRVPVLGTYIWPNNFVGNTHQQELDYMTNWIDDCLQWMNQEIENL